MVSFHSLRCISKTMGPWKSDGEGVLSGQKGKPIVGRGPRSCKKILRMLYAEQCSSWPLIHLN